MTNDRHIRRRRWTQAEDDLIREKYGTMTAAEIAPLIDRTEDAVWIRAVKTLHLDKRGEVAPWTAAELADLEGSYGQEQPADIAARLGRTVSAVYQQAGCMELVSRKYTIVNATVHDYFSGGIRTAEQAYILGLLAADGNVADEHPRVNFGLQESDAHLVAWVRDRLNPLVSLHRKPVDGSTSIQITSRQMVADLAPFGIVPRKSRTIHWPAELGPLLRPFLTGHFDGDGWIYVIRGKYPGWGTCSGSPQFLVEMKEYIRASTGVMLEKIHRRPKTNLWQVATTGTGAYILNEWLHRDGYGLERKRYAESLIARYRA